MTAFVSLFRGINALGLTYLFLRTHSLASDLSLDAPT